MYRKKKQELSMRKIREILRLGLKHKMGLREIARSCYTTHPEDYRKIIDALHNTVYHNEI